MYVWFGRGEWQLPALKTASTRRHTSQPNRERSSSPSNQPVQYDKGVSQSTDRGSLVCKHFGSRFAAKTWSISLSRFANALSCIEQGNTIDFQETYQVLLWFYKQLKTKKRTVGYDGISWEKKKIDDAFCSKN